MFLRIIRFFLGYVSFTACGNSIERFFNLVARSDVTIWNIKSVFSPETHQRCAIADVSASEYKFLRPLAKKSGLKLKVKKKSGFIFFLKKYKKRIGLFLGVFVFFITIHMLSLYVWVVRVQGNVNLTESEIQTVISDLGLKPGILKKYIDTSEIEHATMIHFNNLSWVSVNIEGCFATVLVNESFEPPEIVPKDKPCNIKARCPGQILRMEVYGGQQEVKNGDAVVEGQLLVSGIVDDQIGGTSIIHANAKAIAATTYEVKNNISFYTTENFETGKNFLNRRLHILGLDIPITFQSKPQGNYEVNTSTDILNVYGIPLPISIYKEIWSEHDEIEKTLSIKEAKVLAEKNFEENKQKNFQNKKIIREHREEKVSNESYLLSVTVYCEEDIAVEEPIDLSITN